MRIRQRKRKRSKDSFCSDLMKWHSTSRERLIQTGKTTIMTKSRGRFKACQRFNVQQSPLPLAVDTKHTYEVVSPCSKVWVALPRSGLDNWRTT